MQDGRRRLAAIHGLAPEATTRLVAGAALAASPWPAPPKARRAVSGGGAEAFEDLLVEAGTAHRAQRVVGHA
ncbi:hypothetical protein CLM82_31995 [Streptomyces albidoflavus]|nr:hypothetical protein CLM82_31995 [Streptomyces albidoflavus]